MIANDAFYLSYSTTLNSLLKKLMKIVNIPTLLHGKYKAETFLSNFNFKWIFGYILLFYDNNRQDKYYSNKIVITIICIYDLTIILDEW